MDGCKSSISCAHAVPALAFKIVEEVGDDPGIEVGEV